MPRGPLRAAGVVVLAGMILGGALGSGTAGAISPHPALGLTAKLTATPTTGALPLYVAFTVATTNSTGTESFNFSFGDGSTMSSLVPQVNHTYTWIATFQANVSVTDELGEIAQSSVNVTVTPTPMALTLVALPSIISVGETTVLQANVTGGYPPYTFDWGGLPTGCVGTNVSTLSCDPTYGGGFSVTVAATDTVGTIRNSSVGLVVTGPSAPHTTHLKPPPLGGLSPWATWVAIGVVALAATAGIVGIWYGLRAGRRRKG